MTNRLRAAGLYGIGLMFLLLALIKNKLNGYSTPNTIDPADMSARSDYLYDTVASWKRYLPANFDFTDKDVLELSPGSSLGTGAILLGCGARSYHAIDVFRLAGEEPVAFFQQLLDRMPPDWTCDPHFGAARDAVGKPDWTSTVYRVGEDFDIVRMADGKEFDLVVSCAAFEHYDDIAKTVAQLSQVVRKGGLALHIVDFQTHSRWIRERDPNNIYRYRGWLYRLFSFPGQPNRKRPIDYLRAFHENGWTKVHVVDAKVLSPDLEEQGLANLAPPFDRPAMRMTTLDGVVIAERR